MFHVKPTTKPQSSDCGFLFNITPANKKQKQQPKLVSRGTIQNKKLQTKNEKLCSINTINK